MTMTETERAEKLAAGLKVAADKALLIDHDWLKIVDTSKVTLQADGTVKGADELMAELKKAKPYCFGKRAQEMTPQEYAAKLAELSREPQPQPMPMDRKAKDMTRAERDAFWKESNRRTL